MPFVSHTPRKIEAPSGIIRNGLVLRYDCQEGNGSQLNDDTGNGNHGTLNGNPSWVAGPGGSYPNAIRFDISQWSSAPDDPVLNPSGDMTLCLRFRQTTFNGNYAGIAGKVLGTGWQDGYALYYYLGAIYFFINSYTGGSVNYSFPDNDFDWHHLVGILRGTEINIYLDGVAGIPGTASPMVANAAPFVLSRLPTTYDGFFEEADVRLYNRGLTDPEITQIVNQTG